MFCYVTPTKPKTTVNNHDIPPRQWPILIFIKNISNYIVRKYKMADITMTHGNYIGHFCEWHKFFETIHLIGANYSLEF